MPTWQDNAAPSLSLVKVESTTPSRSSAPVKPPYSTTELLLQAWEDGLMTTRQVVLAAILNEPAVRRLAHNTLLAQKRFAEAGAMDVKSIEQWIQNSHEDTLCAWYWQHGYYEIDVLELILDLKYGLVLGD